MVCLLTIYYLQTSMSQQEVRVTPQKMFWLSAKYREGQTNAQLSRSENNGKISKKLALIQEVHMYS